MSVFHVRLPDVGEGIAEAELVSWLVEVGDVVTQESPLAEVLTDKATVEISSPVEGTIVYLSGNEGEVMAIGTEFVGIEIEGEAPPSRSASGPIAQAGAEVASEAAAELGDEPAEDSGTEHAVEPIATQPSNEPISAPTDVSEADGDTVTPTTPPPPPPPPSTPPPPPVGKSIAAPAVRQRARDLGIELSAVSGSGPEGQVRHDDLDRVIAGSGTAYAQTASRQTPIRGLRRRISQRMSEAWSDIPHITYVDEVDATALETLRKALNQQRPGGPRLTMLPFIATAIVLACAESPECNAHFDSAADMLTEFDAVHVGVATQTPNGLVVPVLRDAQARGIWNLASEIDRLASAARDGAVTAEELSGSTITITSLGAMGGLMTTPIINRPEVSIVGVNSMQVRPVWTDGAFVPRSMFNLSSSFDHRIVDGWVAATFVQRIKALLETPALLFTSTEG